MTAATELPIVLVGNPSPGHVGSHFLEAAERLRIHFEVCDIRRPFAGSAILRTINWRLRGHRPSHLSGFSREVLEAVSRCGARVVLTTGIAPISVQALARLRREGVRLLNYATDDPWSPVARADWFLEGLPLYHSIFTPRRANITDFFKVGCSEVHYLPFAFSPTVHRPVDLDPIDRRRYRCDVVFVGAADKERLAFMTAVAATGARLRLYGRYWERYPATRPFAHGTIPGNKVSHAVAGALVAPCLVRRSNRDGHSMRSYELAAMGACMAVEETAEHREIFGDDGAAVRYFSSPEDLVDRLDALLKDDKERTRLRMSVINRMTDQETYESRLRSILEPFLMD